MINLNKALFLDESVQVLGEIVDWILQLPSVRLSDLVPERSALIVVDMINGFVSEGALQSPRVAGLIPDIIRLASACDELGIVKLAFADSHSDLSPEFDAYPPHCLKGTREAQLVDELQAVGRYHLFPKNSTNGFLEESFQQWFQVNQQIDTYIITGDCTDICIQQLAVTLNAWFNMQNRKARIVVPVNAVDTFHGGLHHGDLMQVMALYSMAGNGVEVVQSIVDDTEA